MRSKFHRKLRRRVSYRVVWVNMMGTSYVKNPPTLPISPHGKITDRSHTPMPKKFGDFFETMAGGPQHSDTSIMPGGGCLKILGWTWYPIPNRGWVGGQTKSESVG